MSALLEVRDLVVAFETVYGNLQVVHGIDMDVHPGESLGIVGESGCGKSVSCLAIMGLLARNARVSGTVRFKSKDLLARDQSQLRALRGGSLAMVFQEPTGSLNPIYTIGRQIGEALRLHRHLRGSDVQREAITVLKKVGIPDPKRRLREYPHELSGGMNQRVMIAIALAGPPKLLIADEPTTALDVTIQAQILALLQSLQEDLGMAVVLVTHDLGIVAEMCNRVAVMYAGQIVELAPVVPLFGQPGHPYTRGLIASLPRTDENLDRLVPIEGRVPAPDEILPGCRFAPRCKHAQPTCREKAPALETLTADRLVACYFPGEEHDAERTP